MPAILCDLCGKAHCGVGLRIIRCTIAVRGDFRVVKPREVTAKVGVRGQAVTAAIHLGHGKRDALPRGGGQRAVAQRAEQAEVALQRLRADRNGAEHVGRAAKLLGNGIEQRADVSGASAMVAGVTMRVMAGLLLVAALIGR